MAGRPLWQETFDELGRPLWQETFDAEEDPEDPPPTPPPAPTIDPLTPQISPRTISGQAIPGATVQVVISLVPHATLTADSNGDWVFVFTASPGNYSIEARQVVESLASEYSEPVVFVILPDVVPPSENGHGGRNAGPYPDEEKRPPQPERPPGVGRLFAPFRRPRAWPGEKD
jgi:hypothetical protein